MSEFEHPTLTPWGYTVDAQTLPDFITSQEFANFTNNKFGSDTRIAAAIPSASEAIRNYCGWHVAPALTCGVYYNTHALRNAQSGFDLLIQLPATFVTSVEKVLLDAKYNAITGDYEGEEVDADGYDLDPSGLLRLFDVGICGKRSRIFVKYVAGYDLALVSSLKELTANRVTHAVVNPYGVNSETAGGISVSYSSLWASGSGANALANDNREILDNYKVRGVY